tara:strand:+ start:395 stop:628 length:234 start_codon:yes stop_codon:yes gene_type:complete
MQDNCYGLDLLGHILTKGTSMQHLRLSTMITALLANGVDPVKVQQLADHDDISTTMMYKDSRRISQEDAANALANLI